MNIELALISKIVRTRNYREARRCGITAPLFQTLEARRMWKEVERYYHNPVHAGRVPSVRHMEKKFPAFETIKCRESIAELADQMRQRAIATDISGAFEEMLELLASDPYRALERLRRLNLETQRHVLGGGAVLLSDVIGGVIERYEEEEQGGLRGIPWPWDEFTTESRGLCPGHLIVLYARPKQMKTWLAVATAVHAYEQANRRVLFYSCEMPVEEMTDRVTAGVARIDADRMRKRKLYPEEKARMVDARRWIEEEAKDSALNSSNRAFQFASPHDDPAGGGIDHLEALAELFQPDLIVADSVYMLSSNKWKDQSRLAQGSKSMATRLNVPFLVTTQRNRERGKGDSVDDILDLSFSDGWAQTADLLMRQKLTAVIAGRGATLEISLRSRTCFKPGFMLQALPAIDYRWLGWLPEESDVPTGAGAESKDATNARRSRKGPRPSAPPQSSATMLEDGLQVDVDIDDVLLH